ncbi:hypothetical protein Taro_041603 [Colocasia esculenta]|uniref:Uncharacterized protein n=1 Tax=Colocasia esculenta TaxID=4460 RepID=A0A843WG97_COLES|nr:hypothetical protein [Colocasia esculenta]
MAASENANLLPIGRQQTYARFNYTRNMRIHVARDLKPSVLEANSSNNLKGTGACDIQLPK